MLMGVLLMAPEARRLLGFLVLDRTIRPSRAPYPFRTRRSRAFAAGAQILLGVWVAVACIHESVTIWRAEGPNRIKPPLYGIWTVEEFTRDGQTVPPLLTDRTRWQRVVFDVPGVMEFQRMDGTFAPLRAEVDAEEHRLELQPTTEAAPFRPTPAQMPQNHGSFAIDRQGPDRLRLDGELDGQPVTVTFIRFDPDTLPQRSHPFSWVMQYANF